MTDLVATLVPGSQITKLGQDALSSLARVMIQGRTCRKRDGKLVLPAVPTSESMYVVDASTSQQLRCSHSLLKLQSCVNRMGHSRYRLLAHLHRLGVLQGCLVKLKILYRRGYHVRFNYSG